MGNESNKKDYEVGYGKPPKHTRWTKGHSGNPSGKPSGSKSWKTLLEEELNREITVFVKGKPEKMTMKQALVRREVQKAVADGDSRTWRRLARSKRLKKRENIR